jgi:hypothetical protein
MRKRWFRLDLDERREQYGSAADYWGSGWLYWYGRKRARELEEKELARKAEIMKAATVPEQKKPGRFQLIKKILRRFFDRFCRCFKSL